MEYALSVENVFFGYHPGKWVLQNVSFSLKKGEFLGLIGPNGGGKTTLLKLLIGVLSPTQGKIKIFGNSPHSLLARKHIGYVPQHSQCPKGFPATVYDIALMGVEKKRLPWQRHSQHEEKLKELAKIFALESILDSPIEEISGGQMRRVFLVRALLRNPSLLILDEPLAGIDSSGQTILFEFIQMLRKEKDIAVIMTSHSVDTLQAQSDQIVCLNRVVHFCDSANLISSQLIRHTYECELETFYHNRDYHWFKNSKANCSTKTSE